MKQFDRIFIIVITVIVIFFAGLNIILVNNNKDLYNGRPYRVEIKRAAAIIKEKGIGSVDLESCKYITNIEKYNKNKLVKRSIGLLQNRHSWVQIPS